MPETVAGRSGADRQDCAGQCRLCGRNDAIWNGLALSGDKPIERLRPAIERVSRDIDAQFVHLLASPNDPRRRLYEAMRHAAIGGGKRLRPLLVQATCERSEEHTSELQSLMRISYAVFC